MKILEENKRISESLIWEWQRNFFNIQGIQAWVDQVPFYITCNPFIAKVYAKLFLTFVSDWIGKFPESRFEPFYLMELGAGSGRFSFYFLKAFEEMRVDFNLQDVNICYVITDVTSHNLKFHREHHALQPFIEKGMLEFAVFDLDKNNALPFNFANPLTVLANYIFDSVSHDGFEVKNKQLSELLVSLSSPRNNVKNNEPIDLEKLKITFKPQAVSFPYFPEKELDTVLENYRQQLKDTNFLIPIGAIRALNYLKTLSNGKIFLMASDKAYSELARLENLNQPSLAFHGSFSMMVNFHALGEYIKLTGGNYFPQMGKRGITTCLYSIGFDLDDSFQRTRFAIKEALEDFSPSDYFNLHKHMVETAHLCPIESILAHLVLSQWDPYIFLKLSTRIGDLLEKADNDSVHYLSQHIHKIAENYYYMPQSECVLFEIGVYFHALKNYSEALKYYYQAESFVGEQFGLHYNMALCLYHSKNHDEAYLRFKRATELSPESVEAKEWETYLRKSAVVQ